MNNIDDPHTNPTFEYSVQRNVLHEKPNTRIFSLISGAVPFQQISDPGFYHLDLNKLDHKYEDAEWSEINKKAKCWFHPMNCNEMEKCKWGLYASFDINLLSTPSNKQIDNTAIFVVESHGKTILGEKGFRSAEMSLVYVLDDYSSFKSELLLENLITYKDYQDVRIEVSSFNNAMLRFAGF